MTATKRNNERYKITSEQIEACVSSLSENHSAILRLSLTEDYSTISKSLGIRLGTVKSRLNRARLALMAAFHKHPNGKPMFSRDGIMLDENGNRSVFDDVTTEG